MIYDVYDKICDVYDMIYYMIYDVHDMIYDMICYDIFNCSWVDTRWQ
jgi:hypothetical protein